MLLSDRRKVGVFQWKSQLGIEADMLCLNSEWRRVNALECSSVALRINAKWLTKGLLEVDKSAVLPQSHQGRRFL